MGNPSCWPRLLACVLVSGLVLGWGALVAQVKASSGATDPKEVIPAVVRAFVQAVDTADIRAFEAQLAPEAIMFFPFQAERADSRKEIVAEMRLRFARLHQRGVGPYFNFVVRDLDIQMLSATSAVATWMMEYASLLQRRTAVLRHADGQWQIVSFHASNVDTSQP